MNSFWKLGTLAPLAAALIGGCATSYQCKAPDGLRCMSVGEVYERNRQGLPMRMDETDTPRVSENSRAGSRAQRQHVGAEASAAAAGEPIYNPPRVLRVWFADWEDADGVYYRAHHVLMRLDAGSWIPPEVRVRFTGAGSGDAP